MQQTLEKRYNVRTNTESVQLHHFFRDSLLGAQTYRGDVIDHVTNRFAICHFLLAAHWNRTSTVAYSDRFYIQLYSSKMTARKQEKNNSSNNNNNRQTDRQTTMTIERTQSATVADTSKSS